MYTYFVQAETFNHVMVRICLYCCLLNFSVFTTLVRFMLCLLRIVELEISLIDICRMVISHEEDASATLHLVFVCFGLAE